MGIEHIIQDKEPRGPTEALPNYREITDRLLETHRHNPTVPRGELKELISDRGNVESLLQTFVDKGYLLHGSPSHITELEPRRGNDSSGDPQNLLTAVYAIDVPAVAIFMSLRSAKLQKGTSLRSFFSVVDHVSAEVTLSRFGANKLPADFLDAGYVYILNRDEFAPTSEDNHHQYASEKPVRPKLIIPTQVEDFKHAIEQIT